MFILGHFLTAFTDVLDWLLQALEFVIIIRVILSWVNADPYNNLVKAIYTIAEPFLKPFRKLLPPWKLHGLDLSPVFALLAIFFIKQFLIATLLDISGRLQ